MKEKTLIIAILGMPGSGKTEAIEYLRSVYLLPKVYFGKVTFDETERRGLPINAENERNIREELRARNGKDYYANEVIKMIDENSESSTILVESLYSWTEYQTLRRHYEAKLHTIAIHASPALRHRRLATRPIRPHTKEESEIRDVAQIEQLEQGGPIALADHVLVNEGELGDMTGGLDRIMSQLGLAKPA
jgi:dephospho-CoA kinase